MIFNRYLAHPSPDWNIYDFISSVFKTFFNDPINDLKNAIIMSTGSPNVLVTNLGRTALIVGLKALGLKDNSGVILPTVICKTVLDSVLRAGLRPILVDINTDLHMHPYLLPTHETVDAAVIIVPHLYGMSAPISGITEWARLNNIYVVDDAAQSAGIKLNGRYTGTFGDFGILSFGPFKSLSCPRGGALLCANYEFFKRAGDISLSIEPHMEAFRRMISCYLKGHARPIYLGCKDLMKNLLWNYRNPDTTPKGSNFQGYVDDLSYLNLLEAGLVHNAYLKLSDIISRRRLTAHNVYDALRVFDAFEFVGPGDAPYIKIPIRILGRLTASETVSRLRNLRIEAERIYPPLHYLDSFKNKNNYFPNADKCWQNIFLLPNPTRCPSFALKRYKSAFEILSRAGA